jgi:hypothetical protein
MAGSAQVGAGGHTRRDKHHRGRDKKSPSTPEKLDASEALLYTVEDDALTLAHHKRASRLGTHHLAVELPRTASA